MNAGHNTNLPERQIISDAALLDIQAAINLIPCVGGVLATYFGEIREKRVSERMLAYFEYFSQRLQKIEDSKIDKEYLRSEEFAELFMQGAEEAARSTTVKRIKRFANILINNALLGAEARERTQSIMSFVDRISDLDAFVLLSYGSPAVPSLRAGSKEEASRLVESLASFLGIDSPPKERIYEAIIYMDNLGVTWVNENRIANFGERGKDLILKEFSSFRTPLGDAIAAVIAPPGFYLTEIPKQSRGKWPEGHLSSEFQKKGGV